MKKKPLFFAAIFLLPGLFIAGTNTKKNQPSNNESNRDIISCAPAGDNIFKDENGKFIAVLPGWGNHALAVSTSNDSAQFYFNQGLSMYYSYHSREAIASFKESARFDPALAMAYWGQALASGPNYNSAYGYKIKTTVPAIVNELNKPALNASMKERDLIDAVNSRYNIADTADSKRKMLNETYAAKMKALVDKYSDDLEIKTLYVDAVMLMHEWDFWNNDGSPKPWTPELVNLCETVLKANPVHPGALHYYIHVTEASHHPEVALHAADVLKDLLPGVAHMVHMSSHEYERVGLYAKGVAVNEKADGSFVLYDSLLKGIYPVRHVPHYLAVEAYCAISGGMYKRGLPKAVRCRNNTKPDYKNTYDQYLYAMPLFAMVRMGKWDAIIADTTAPVTEWTYASLLYDFAKGMAYARTGNIRLAEKYLASLNKKSKDSILTVKFVPYTNAPYKGAVIASNILHGAILFSEKKYKDAIDALTSAIKTEDSLVYIEPKQWMLPARQYLGSILLKINKPVKAEKTYRDDLYWNPGNGWSLLGLYKSLAAQGKLKEANKYKLLYTQSFSEADEIPPGSVY